MKITILNGDMNKGNSSFSNYIEKLNGTFGEEHEISVFHINKMKLKYCTGCWSCWWKTPGECSIKDGADEIFRSVINSDFFIFASPLIAGFTSSELKKITDRLIVLLHPYVEFRNEESHHQKRYSRYPDFGLILQKEADTDSEDVKIISDIYDRLALNFHSEKKYLKFIDEANPEDIVYETCNI